MKRTRYRFLLYAGVLLVLASVSIACTDPTGPESGIQDDDAEDAPPNDDSADDHPLEGIPSEERPGEEQPTEEQPTEEQPPSDEELPVDGESGADESGSPPPDSESPPPGPSGELGVTVQHDLPGAFPLSSLQDTVELAYRQPVTLSLPISADYETIAWSLNGEAIAGETGLDLTIGENLAPGRHTVSVMVETGAVRGSRNIVLRVRRTPADRVILGRNRGYLLTESGDLYGWGTQYVGILLNGEFSGEVANPEFLMADVLDVDPALSSTFVLTGDGVLAVAGLDPFGLFGLPSHGFLPTPRQIETQVVALSASRSHVLYVRENADGTQSLWGWGDEHGIARDIDHREPVHIMDGIVAIAAGYQYSLAITDDGDLYGWGRNANHQLGIGSSDAVAAPRLLATNAVSISAGDDAAGYIDSVGNLYTSGLKYRVPSAETQTEWTHARSGVRAVEMGSSHSFIIDDNDDLWAWGINGGGELGTGDFDLAVMPVRVLRDVRSEAAGSTFQHGFSGAVRGNGTLSTWGVDLDESLGNGSAGDSLVPLEVTW